MIPEVVSAPAKFVGRTCVNGHPWIEENRMVVRENGVTGCRVCRRLRTQKHRRDQGPKVYYMTKQKWSQMKSNYGLDKRDWVNMLLGQLGRCRICDENMDKPCVDHCHSTGRVRGMLCRRCNTLLGGVEVVTLKKVMEYLA